MTVAAAPTPAPVLASTPQPATVAATVAENTAPTPPIVVAAAPNPVPAPATDPIPGTADQPSAAEAGVPQPTATARVSEDTVLARIVANLDNPAPVPTPTPAPRSRPAPTPAFPPVEAKPKPAEEPKPAATRTRGKPSKNELADAQIESAKGKAPQLDARGRPIKTKDADDEPAPALDKNGCPIPPKPARGKAAAPVKTRKPMTAREKANDLRCKTATAKAKADAETRGEPARVWVQVAGGANEGDLRKAWAALQAKAPDLFRGRQGWSTPLRATNRVLTGPFKSDDEAQAFVNRMSKAGLSGFVFTSAKGQKIDRLGAK